MRIFILLALLFTLVGCYSERTFKYHNKMLGTQFDTPETGNPVVPKTPEFSLWFASGYGDENRNPRSFDSLGTPDAVWSSMESDSLLWDSSGHVREYGPGFQFGFSGGYTFNQYISIGGFMGGAVLHKVPTVMEGYVNERSFSMGVYQKTQITPGNRGFSITIRNRIIAAIQNGLELTYTESYSSSSGSSPHGMDTSTSVSRQRTPDVESEHYFDILWELSAAMQFRFHPKAGIFVGGATVPLSDEMVWGKVDSELLKFQGYGGVSVAIIPEITASLWGGVLTQMERNGYDPMGGLIMQFRVR